MVVEGLRGVPYFGTDWMRAHFQQEGKVEVKRQWQNSLPRQGAISESPDFRNTEWPLGPYTFLELSSERAEMTSLEVITTLGVKELEGIKNNETWCLYIKWMVWDFEINKRYF